MTDYCRYCGVPTTNDELECDDCLAMDLTTRNTGRLSMLDENNRLTFRKIEDVEGGWRL